jgi:hypothetical protein
MLSPDRLETEAVLRVGEVTAVTGRRIFISVDTDKNLSELFFDGDVLRNIAVGIAKAARRLRALEKEINDMAGDPPLLKWETEFGMGGIVGGRYLKWKERRAEPEHV